MNHVDIVTQPTFANSVVKVKHVPAVLSEGVYGQNMCSFLSSGKTEGGSKRKRMGRVGRKSSREEQAAVLSWIDSQKCSKCDNTSSFLKGYLCLISENNQFLSKSTICR